MKLGALVLVGTTVLVIGLYLLGNKRDMFSRNVTVEAMFSEVSGLREGNNVRYAGINVGTVKEMEITSDTSVIVRMILREEAARHIRTSAVARIASDGLMGNKLVNLEPGDLPGEPLTDGSRLQVGRGIDTDAMLRTLSGSNDNLAAITMDLRDITRRLNDSSGLLGLLNDTLVSADVKVFIHELRSAAASARSVSGRVDRLVSGLEDGQGAIGALVSDTVAEREVRDLIRGLHQAGDSLTAITGELGHFSRTLNDPHGTIHLLSRDPAATRDVQRIIANLDSSSATLNEDLKALQESFLLRRYFKKKERKGR